MDLPYSIWALAQSRVRVMRSWMEAADDRGACDQVFWVCLADMLDRLARVLSFRIVIVQRTGGWLRCHQKRWYMM